MGSVASTVAANVHAYLFFAKISKGPLFSTNWIITFAPSYSRSSLTLSQTSGFCFLVLNSSLLHKKCEDRIQATAQRIKAFRKEAGFTSYEDFAISRKLDRKHYWRMETGQNMSLKTLFKLIDI